MRILHLSMDYPPRHAGGTTVHTYRLTHELARLGHAVSVIAASAPGAPKHEENEVRVFRVPRPYTYFSARKAREWMEEFDVVHGHGICAYGMLKKRHPPTVVKLHNVWAQELEAYRRLKGAASWRYVHLSMPKYVRMDRSCCERADRLISISDYISNGVEEYGVEPGKVDLIRNGVDVSRFDGVEPEDLGLKRPVVAYVGRLAPHKGVDSLPRICRKAGVGSLLVVGAGPSERIMRLECGSLGLDNHFAGVVPHDDVPAYYLAADIVVYPTLYEPLGNVILEGMAAGKPVVARDTGGIPEILPEGAGFTYADPRDLVTRLKQLIGDGDLRERMGDAGRRAASERSWADVARDTEKVLKRVLEEGSN